MADQLNRLSNLFEQYAQVTCTPEELKEFWQLLNKHSGTSLLKQEMQGWWGKVRLERDPAELVDWPGLFDHILQREKEYHVRPVRKQLYRWIAVAGAAVLIGVGIGLWT